MNNSENQISKEISKYLFLSNLNQSNDDKIDDLIKSLKTIVQTKANKKLHYLSSLDFKLKMIKYKSIIEEKTKNNF
jgi:hypothetical protein